VNDFSEVADLCPSVPGGSLVDPEGGILLDALLDLVMNPGLLDSAPPNSKHTLVFREVITGLGIVTVDEVVDEVTRGTTKVNTNKPPTKADSLLGRSINTVVMMAVVVNLCTMGLSIDRAPDHVGWLFIEAVCVSIYITEAVFKLTILGAKEYFWGEACIWNCMDFFITSVSALELSVTVSAHAFPDLMGGSEEQASSAFQVAVLLRVLRVARVVRMAKLVRNPMLSDLANMLTGFIIGIPSLSWVLVLFVFILYMVGLIFRLFFGPADGQNLMSVCGPADDIVDLSNADCPVHWIYGEEFFGTVQKSMFTSFRFMLGDYSTRGGKSIIVAFSQGYGKMFEVVFVSWMIMVIFGLFNIITAIFVDSTISGLKYNDIKRKYAKQYERKYVTSKLSAILERMQDLHNDYILTHDPTSCSPCLQDPWMKVWDTTRICFDKDEFVFIMGDGAVKELFQDIDIDMANPLGLFDTFDPTGDGKVTVPEMIGAIMLLRGEPEKKDIISGWLAIKALHEKFDKLTKLVTEGSAATDPLSQEAKF